MDPREALQLLTSLLPLPHLPTDGRGLPAPLLPALLLPLPDAASSIIRSAMCEGKMS